MQGKSFIRFSALKAAILAVLDNPAIGKTAKQLEVHDLLGQKQYQSRGKGGGYRPQGSRMKIFAAMRNQRSKYQPHQGKQEVARRLGRRLTLVA